LLANSERSVIVFKCYCQRSFAECISE